MQEQGGKPERRKRVKRRHGSRRWRGVFWTVGFLTLALSVVLLVLAVVHKSKKFGVMAGLYFLVGLLVLAVLQAVAHMKSLRDG